ncbi:hypothetical protein GTQ48_09690 [Alteromonas genovensis]|uniref:Uncharacterized protein n=1 Tax=Alteromonas genovensis TaxID=471225 RepID=A0A6N9TM90_9ALTE|nr:hypothetical protein [Alteromonas genovensis]NDW15788.1 hypothetical protein [Alteromonas genovensis]
MLKLISLIGLLFSGGFAFKYGDSVSASNQLEIYKMLVTVAALVFAVMGAWLSLLKVELESQAKNAKSVEDAAAAVKKSREFIEPMTYSAMIIVASLFFTFCYYVMKDFQLESATAKYLRQFSFMFVTILTYSQLWTLMKVMFSGVDYTLSLSRISKERISELKRH